MNREIKFRAWGGEKDHKYFVYFDLDNVMDNHFEDLTVDNGARLIHSKGKGLEISQFTGLKDKNGKEIYEGDILQGHSPNDDYNEEQDSWAEKGFRTQVDFEDGAFVVEACTGDYDRTAIGWAMDAGFVYEIIGNIYENPELLTN